MGLKVITVRGRRIAVETKTGAQLERIKKDLEERTDAQLEEYAEDTRQLSTKYPTRGIE